MVEPVERLGGGFDGDGRHSGGDELSSEDLRFGSEIGNGSVADLGAETGYQVWVAWSGFGVGVGLLATAGRCCIVHHEPSVAPPRRCTSEGRPGLSGQQPVDDGAEPLQNGRVIGVLGELVAADGEGKNASSFEQVVT